MNHTEREKLLEFGGNALYILGLEQSLNRNILDEVAKNSAELVAQGRSLIEELKLDQVCQDYLEKEIKKIEAMLQRIDELRKNTRVKVSLFREELAA